MSAAKGQAGLEITWFVDLVHVIELVYEIFEE